MPTLMKMSIAPMGNILLLFQHMVDGVHGFPFLLNIYQQLCIVIGPSIKSVLIL